MNDETKLPLIGRDRVLIENLTKEIRDGLRDVEVAPIYRRTRGNMFEVKLTDGRIAKINVELDRVES